MAAIIFRCPNCGGDLVFDPQSQQYKCEYCLSVFSKEEAEKANPHTGQFAEEAQGKAADERTDGRKAEQAAAEGQAMVYTCPSCGAEIVTDETMAATFCFYCHNPVVLSGRISGEYLPDKVLPFMIDRKRAEECFWQEVKRKRFFLPKDFYDSRQIEKLSGVYFPYWLYEERAEGVYHAKGRKIRVWRSGDTEYTETSVYDVRREGEATISGLTHNALDKEDRDLIESVQPYNIDRLQPFSMAYLSGFYAEKRNLEKERFFDRTREQADQLLKSAFRPNDAPYRSLEQERLVSRPLSEKWEYVMFPVWMLTYRGKNKKTYYFAMNGQGGAVSGDFPIEWKKLLAVAGGLGTAVFLLLLLLGYLL